MMMLFALFAAFASRPVPLNTASASEIEALDGVSAAVAQRVVQLRSERGRLGSVDELRIFPDVPESALDSLRKSTAVDIEMPLGSPQRFDSPQAVLGQFAGEPSAQHVQAWASAYAQMSPDHVRKWLAQTQSMALLPILWVRYRLTQDADQDFQYYANDGQIDQEGEVLFNVLDDAGVAVEHQFLVQARWDLDQLIMNPRRTQMIRENRNYVKLRDKILTEVNRLYFERRRIQTEMLLSPKSDLLGQTKDQLRVMELTANLDALTGGRFSAALARRGSGGPPR